MMIHTGIWLGHSAGWWLILVPAPVLLPIPINYLCLFVFYISRSAVCIYASISSSQASTIFFPFLPVLPFIKISRVELSTAQKSKRRVSSSLKTATYLLYLEGVPFRNILQV